MRRVFPIWTARRARAPSCTGGEVFEGVGVGDGCVVEVGQGFLVDDAGHLGLDLGAGKRALAAEGLRGVEGFPIGRLPPRRWSGSR